MGNFAHTHDFLRKALECSSSDVSLVPQRRGVTMDDLSANDEALNVLLVWFYCKLYVGLLSRLGLKSFAGSGCTDSSKLSYDFHNERV